MSNPYRDITPEDILRMQDEQRIIDEEGEIQVDCKKCGRVFWRDLKDHKDICPECRKKDEA